MTRLCEVLQVSTTGFYDWCQRKPSVTAGRRKQLTQKIRVIHASNRQVYGSPRVHEALLAERVSVSLNTVASLMKLAEIKAKPSRRHRVTTESRHGFKVAKNHLNRCFQVASINQAWAGDVTYIPTGQGAFYLAVVMELFSRRIIGWSMDKKNTSGLVCRALSMAIDQCGSHKGTLVHSDRGIQYVSGNYQSLLAQHGLVCSMSRKGNCWDNAVVESFFRTLKAELDMFVAYKTRNEARTTIFEYIECFYNRSRLHSTIGYKSPADYEKIHCAA